jgi:CheY-like chemotaxis protein
VSVRISRPGPRVDLSQSHLDPKTSIAVAISDTGIGIPRAKQSMIFEAFQQADGSIDRRYGGTGLGLSISTCLARSLGGEIQLQSDEGQGSTFTLILPENVEAETQADWPDEGGRSSDATCGPPAGVHRDAVHETPCPAAQVISDDRGNITSDDDMMAKPPVVVYSGKDLSRVGAVALREHCDNVVLKGVESPERLLDETSLFLHRIEAALPPAQQRMIRKAHEKETILYGKKVLIVDDDIRNIFALSHALKSKGMAVSQAENGQKALDALEIDPDIDIVLMDIMMPVMDGYEAMQRIRAQEKYARLPILALTAKAMPNDRQKCIEAGANDYMAKPVDIDKVLSMLRVWLYV